MKKIALFTFIISLSTLQLFSQNKPKTQCISDDLHDEMLNSNIEYKQKMEAFDDAQMAGFYDKNRPVTLSTDLYRVPIVFHIFHKGETIGEGTNISEESINQAIIELNQRLRNTSGNWGVSTGADMNIEFALAIQDPQGNSTNGIERIDMSANSDYVNFGLDRSSGNGVKDADIKALSRWDANKYYNVYIVSEIDDNECGSGTAGYAYFASSHGQSFDGMVETYCKITSPGNNTFIHELGHALNLYHTFEGDEAGTNCPPEQNGCGNGQGDCCGDTPPHIRSPTGSCDTITNTCTTIASSSNSNIHNYMDYTGDVCQTEFTVDQVTRARLALTTTRSSFLTSTAFNPVTSPVADFSVSSSGVCTGSTIMFYDNSSSIPNTFKNDFWTGISHSWTFDNGVNTPITSNLQNPEITFNNAGVYSVTLTVTSLLGSNTITKTGVVTIASGFPKVACIPTSTNEGKNYDRTVSNVTFAGINNNTSKRINAAYTDYSCSQIAVVSPSKTYNLSITLNQRSHDENADVYIDYDNDGVFSISEKIMSVVLPDSGGTGQKTFTQSITIPANLSEGDFLRMRVLGEANNIGGPCDNNFIGDVEDYGVYISTQVPTFIQKQNNLTLNGVKVYPNPTSNQLFLDYTLLEPSEVSVSIISSLGKTVYENILSHQPAGSYNLDISNNIASSGIYTLLITINGASKANRLVKLN